MILIHQLSVILNDIQHDVMKEFVYKEFSISVFCDTSKKISDYLRNLWEIYRSKLEYFPADFTDFRSIKTSTCFLMK